MKNRYYWNTMLFLVLIFIAWQAHGQAYIGNPIIGNETPPGLVYFDGNAVTGMDFEIGFRIDSEKLNASSLSGYSCGWTPSGMWLYDRHPHYNATGRWMITLSRNGDMCFRDMPSQGYTTIEFQGVPVDQCLTLTATHTGGILTVSVDGQTITRNTGIQNPTYQSGPNGIGVGREINGWHGRWDNQSFMGDIFHLRDGSIFPLQVGTLTGNTSFGLSVCDAGTPPPPPPPPPGPCDTDPNGVECACETNPHPACNVCLAP